MTGAGSSPAVGRVWGGLAADERERLRRGKLLDAGLEVFAAAGWNGATVAAICRTARLSQRYFYELFVSREALFVAVCERIADDVQHVMNAAVEDPGHSPEERARGVLGALATHFAADPRIVRVALVESFATPELRVHRARLIDSFTKLGARMMRSLHPTPDRADGRLLELSAAVLAGGIVEILISGAAGARTIDADELLDHASKLFRAAATLE